MLINILQSLDIQLLNSGTSTGTFFYPQKETYQYLESFSPTNGSSLAKVAITEAEQYHQVVTKAREAFLTWRLVPAPHRGEIVRQIGDELRKHKTDLGSLVSLEMGKILAEGLGEVQEMIDICDFAVGLSRQLYGLTIASERSGHRMMEQWHPLGVIGIISAFNFPVAVWAWNAMLAAVCGDVCIWKPSEKTPLCAIAVQKIVAKVLKANHLPEGIFSLINGDASLGKLMAEDHNIPLVSATGSIRMGKQLAPTVAARLGRSLLELGGNNAIIVAPSADLEMAIRAIVFGAAGAAGQRCTSTRRIICHSSIFDELKNKLVKIYEQITIGDPLNAGVLVGPLIDKHAVEMFTKAIEEVKKQGGKIIYGGELLTGEGYESGCFVKPCMAEVKPDLAIIQEETFAPLLYLMEYEDFNEAIYLHNNVRQGLSSSIFTLDMREAETFLSAVGSDCGIANVNIGTSGAEIGGAFGGEKETGGGRESGTDSWKNYMRRQTNTINYSATLPLAQGIEFAV